MTEVASIKIRISPEALAQIAHGLGCTIDLGERDTEGFYSPTFTRRSRPGIVREAVVSSNVKSVGYDRASETLEVEFQDGSVYRYEDVTDDEYLAFAEAESKGGHLARVIRPNHLNVWRRVEVKA